MRILIIKTSSLGDILQTFPLLAFLKKRAPHARIDWVVEERCSELLERHPLLDRVIRIDSKRGYFNLKELRKYRYEQIYDPQGNCKSSLILMLARGRERIGFASPKEWPNRLFTSKKVAIPPHEPITRDYLRLATEEIIPFEDTHFLLSEQEEREVESLGSSSSIIVAPGSFWKNKRLKEAGWKEVLKQFEGRELLFIYATQEEEMLARKLQTPTSRLIGKLPLYLLQRLMQKVSLVIAVDSLALHLAATTKTATLSFFGPSSAAKYAPQGPQHRFIQGVCPYHECFEKRCRYLRSCKTAACMDQVAGGK